MTAVSLARLAEIAEREATEHTSECAVGVIDDQPCLCGGLVAITREERDALVALARKALPSKPPTPTVTRVEVIDETGRRYGRWNCRVDMHLQDDGRTLKLFVSAPADQPRREETNR